MIDGVSGLCKTNRMKHTPKQDVNQAIADERRAFHCDWMIGGEGGQRCNKPADYIHVGWHTDLFYCQHHHGEVCDYETKRAMDLSWMSAATAEAANA